MEFCKRLRGEEWGRGGKNIIENFHLRQAISSKRAVYKTALFLVRRKDIRYLGASLMSFL